MVWKLGKSVYEKVMTKRICKKGWSSSATILLDIGLLSVNWAIPEKRWWLRTYFFKKPMEFLGLLFHSPWEILYYFLIPGNSTCCFFNIPGRSRYWSWDTKENNLEYFLFGRSISLLAICSSFSLFYLWGSHLKKTLKPTKFFQVYEFIGN